MLVISTHIPKSPQKVRNWSDPPPLRQMTTEKLLFFRDGFPKVILFIDQDPKIYAELPCFLVPENSLKICSSKKELNESIMFEVCV